MAKQGGPNQIGEANVRITGDISDLKAKVAEANKELGKVGSGGRRGGRGGGGSAGDGGGGVSESGGEFRGFRRILGIGAFIAATAASLVRLGQALRDAVTHERAYSEAIEERGLLARKSAEEEIAGLKLRAEALSKELGGFRDPNFASRNVYRAAQTAIGRDEKTVQALYEDIVGKDPDARGRGGKIGQLTEAQNRLNQARAAEELTEIRKLNARIVESLETFREQQREASDRALAAQQISARRLEEVIRIRADNARR